MSFGRAERCVIGVAVAANVAQRARPPGARFASNLAAAGAATLIARHEGLTWRELGLDREGLTHGLRWGAGTGAIVAATLASAGTSRAIRSRFADGRVRAHASRRAAYEFAARIPLETALAEEIIFRGALLGLALRQRSPVVAVGTTSVLFGLWHVLPTWNGFSDSAVGSAVGPGVGTRRPARAGAVAGVVAATAMAGAGFASLRLRSGSIVAPVLLHAALNMTAFALARTDAVDRRVIETISKGSAP